MMHLSEFQPEHVLILSGDHLYQMDYRAFIRHHEDTGANVTLSVCPTDELRAPSFGLLKTDDEGHVIEFREKPPRDQLADMRVNTASLGLKHDAEQLSYLASMGVYVFKFETLRAMLREGKHTDFGGELIPAAIRNHKVQAYLFDGYWEDIGTISSFYNANLDMTNHCAEVQFLQRRYADIHGCSVPAGLEAH
jgi:glucose-1-phosphate adenylyltransferase